MASEILNISTDQAIANCKKIDDIDAYCFWSKERGGKTVIIGSNKEKLVAPSNISLDQHIEEFVNGRRT